jgi:hypothetical protein
MLDFLELTAVTGYLGYQQPAGAQLKYLARDAQGPLAALSFGPAALHLGPRDQFIGWSGPSGKRGCRGWSIMTAS